MIKQRSNAMTRKRQLAAVKKIWELAAKVSNEDIQDEVDSLFANITSTCHLIEQEIQKQERQ